MRAIEAVSVGILVADVIARPVRGTAEKGRLELVDEVLLCSGGSAANTGYVLARFGIPTAVIGRVGQDGFGDFLVAEARRHGAESLLIRDPSAATSATQVLVDEEGERTFIHAIGANARLVPGDVPLEDLRARGARLLHLAGYFALPGMEGVDGGPARDLFARAVQLGYVTSLDNVWNARGNWELINPLLPHTDIFCPSIHDARHITRAHEPYLVAQKLFELGVRRVVALKMGAEGSLVMSREGESYQLPIVPIHTVDGTGSGDAFIAGFLAAWLRGMSLEACAKYGNAGGAMAARAMGAMNGITDWGELEILAKQIL
ncbi:carbohydrate kinase family protein [Meiothermus ruber]|jgi:sugar/nucleoside kinase (ribokinase family)|uniref:PfkB domain protein n=3 Tax=Meiothermus ruber TaxID=277 RepID=A0A806CKL4_MEIRD|nr:carbohydrate kinase family protein [Meiothermus ruber]ADD28040.1 PfkB domain protein [Meiothermus ruber DSM 1279]MCX7801684.1 carbohydrate kinase family protein [Meiothermus ruber]GAO74986.1 PfkB domain-containing protein [Meiothermus ruber H328]